MRIIVIKEGWRGRKVGDTGEVLDNLGRELIAQGYVREYDGVNREMEAIMDSKPKEPEREIVFVPVEVPVYSDNQQNNEDGNDGDN